MDQESNFYIRGTTESLHHCRVSSLLVMEIHRGEGSPPPTRHAAALASLLEQICLGLAALKSPVKSSP